jgi:hypothetical protein
MSDARLDQLVEAVRDHSGLSLREIEQAGEHGADAGWSGFTYTTDGAEFTGKNVSLVWDLLADEADSFGAPNVAAHVASFTRCDMAQSPEGFDCLLSWWALETAGRYLVDTREERDESEREAMRSLGEEHGKAASSWILDGNSTQEAAERLLRGILEGDPEVLDSLPSSPLSGEWADAASGAELVAEAGLDFDGSDPDSAERESELLDAYSDGYSEGVHDGAEATARAWLGIPEGAAAEVLGCTDCGRDFVAASGVNYCATCEDRAEGDE